MAETSTRGNHWSTQHRVVVQDAIIMNRASLDRGFGRCIVHHTYKATLKKYANRAQDRIVAPEERRDKSHLIESDGLAVVGRVIHPGVPHFPLHQWFPYA